MPAALAVCIGLVFLAGCRSEDGGTTTVASPSPSAAASSASAVSAVPPQASASAASDAAIAKHDGAGARVSVVRLQPQVVPVSVTLPGRVAAFETSDVRPQVGGIVTRRTFIEGAAVRAGQPLYQIDAARYEAAYAQATAALAGARAAVPLARAVATRERTLLAAGATSQLVYDQAVARLAQDEAALGAARAAQRRAALDRDRAVVRAPIDGYIDRSEVSAGALVVADQPDALTRIHRIDRVYVDLRQAARQVRDMRRIAAASGATGPLAKRTTVTLTLAGNEPYPHAGWLDLTLAESRVAVDTDTVALRAVFENPDRTLLPGMYVHASIVVGTVRDAFLLPQRAVSRNARGAPVVWVVAQGKAEKRVLPQARPHGNDWLVGQGIEPGTLLVVDGEMHLREGAAVGIDVVRIDAATGAIAPEARP